MKLIVGLGNPGDKYKNTRHNIGFNILDLISKENNFDFANSKFNCDFAKVITNEENLIFIKPTDFMNNSGNAVQKVMNYYGIQNDDLLVIYDDKDLDIGKIKFKSDGSAGGHNGIKDIIEKIGTKDFLRLRIGIGTNGQQALEKYVLNNFSEIQKIKLNEKAKIILKSIEDFSVLSNDELKNKYNGV